MKTQSFEDDVTPLESFGRVVASKYANHIRILPLCGSDNLGIGVNKRVIVVAAGFGSMVLYNPVIVKKSGPCEAEEGCLSLTGTRRTTRYRTIEVEYRDADWKKQSRVFTDRTAQIIQHEIDHTNGILI